MRLFLKYLLLSLIWFESLFAQQFLQDQLDNADKLFKTEHYFDAITEYKRALYFSSDTRVHAKINIQIAHCYKAGSHFDNAIKYFSLSEKIITDDSLDFILQSEIIRCNILRKSTQRALQLCDELEKDIRFVSKKEIINYWRGWAFMIADDWESASQCFAQNEDSKELKTLCQQVVKDKVSVTFAKVISYILPGSGQIYSGEIFSGLMSLAWNLAAGYFTVNAFMANRAFDGVVIGELIWLRFYRGNLENAEDFAVEKNLLVANRALNYLQNEYRGQKP